LHVAMRRAGWVLAEERTLASAWSMIRSTLLRRSYPEAPVSHLYLMGRRHDFTYQQEVGGTTTKRHHVRFWRMPPDFVLPGGYRADWLAPAPTTAPSASPSSPCRSRTGSTRTSTPSATSWSTPSGTPIRRSTPR